MRRLALVLATGGLLLVSAAHSADKARYSGHIKTVSPDGPTIVLEEVGPGIKGSSTNQVISRSITLTPATRITLASRTEDGNGSSEWAGGFKETPLAASDLRVGDYSTVEAQTQSGRLVAVSVVVVRPTNSSQ